MKKIKKFIAITGLMSALLANHVQAQPDGVCCDPTPVCCDTEAYDDCCGTSCCSVILPLVGIAAVAALIAASNCSSSSSSSYSKSHHHIHAHSHCS